MVVIGDIQICALFLPAENCDVDVDNDDDEDDDDADVDGRDQSLNSPVQTLASSVVSSSTTPQRLCEHKLSFLNLFRKSQSRRKGWQ